MTRRWNIAVADAHRCQLGICSGEMKNRLPQKYTVTYEAIFQLALRREGQHSPARKLAFSLLRCGFAIVRGEHPRWAS
jgi:hypothetical protein